MPHATTDAAGGFVGRDPDGHPLREEQPDDLTGVRLQLLADDDAARQLLCEFVRALDRVVIGHAEHVDAARDDGRRDLVRGRRRVTAPHGVAVHVDTHPATADRRGQMGMPGNGVGGCCGHPAKVAPA